MRTRALLLLLASATIAVAAAGLALRPRPAVRDRVRDAAEARLAAREVDEAVRAADLAFVALDGAADAACLSAAAHAAGGDLATAYARLEAAAARAPDAPEPALSAGLVLRRMARDAREPGVVLRRAGRWFDEAVQRADAVARRAPESASVRVLAACARLAAGDADDALRRADDVAETAVGAAAEEAACVRAAALATLERWDEASLALRDLPRPRSARVESALRRIDALRAAAAEPDRARGLRAWRRGDAEVAAARLDRWADHRPWDPASLAVLAAACARLDRTADVARRLDRLAAAPSPAAVPWFRACHLLALGRPDDAAVAFDAAESLAPDDPVVRVGRIHAGLRALRDAQAAGLLSSSESALRERAGRSPDATSWFLLGSAAEMRGDDAAAESRYREALRIDPRCGPAANQLAWLLAVRCGRAAEASVCADDAVRLLPGDPHALDTRAAVRLRLGDARGACDDSERARALRPHDAGFALRHASALAAAGDADAARDALRVAVRLSPALADDAAFRAVASPLGLERTPR